MKIRSDFVTNSSSTSFLIISNGEFDLKNFLQAVGIAGSSPFLDIYSQLFDSFQDELRPAREYFERWCGPDSDFNEFGDFIKKRYSENTWRKVQEAEQSGKQVFVGELSSDTNEVEAFFCTDSFIIDSPNLYIDAKEDAW